MIINCKDCNTRMDIAPIKNLYMRMICEDCLVKKKLDTDIKEYVEEKVSKALNELHQGHIKSMYELRDIAVNLMKFNSKLLKLFLGIGTGINIIFLVINYFIK